VNPTTAARRPVPARRAASTDRRAAIVTAALELFAERGLAATSVDDIRAASGASVGSIYHHFGSKEGIAAALYIEAIADYQDGALAELRAARSSAAGIRAMVTHFLGWVGDHPQLAALMLEGEYGEVRGRAAADVEALNRDYFTERRRWVDERIAAGELAPVPADLFVWAVLGPAWRYAELWIGGHTTTPLNEAARLLSELAWSGLRPDGGLGSRE
jgi:AcrR family transcriptional regulator